MPRLLLSFMTPQPSKLALALALVVSSLVTTVQADTPLGNDAPAPTTATPTSTPSSGNGGLSETDKIIIGVVVGVVALSTIAGIAFFVSYKKRRRNRKIHAEHDAKGTAKKQQQEQSHYFNNPLYMMQQQQQQQQHMSLRNPRRTRQREPDPEEAMLEISELDRDATRDSMLPKYDPSSFHTNQYSMDSTRGLSIDMNRGLSIDMPREALISYHHNRNSLSFSGAVSPPLASPPLPPPPPPPPVPSGGWIRRKTSLRGYNNNNNNTNVQPPMGPPRPSNDISSAPADAQASSNNQERPKGPKKPKPTLARLITNL